MTFEAAANTTYWIEIVGTFLTAATSTGMGLALDIPSGTVFGVGWHGGTTSGTIVGFESVADAQATAASVGVRAANQEMLFAAKFRVTTAETAGTVQLMFRSEVASSATLKAGTVMQYRISPV